MGQGFLIDSNAVIDYLGNWCLPPVPCLLTRMEVLGWYNAFPKQIAALTPFIQAPIVYPIGERIVLPTLLFRQRHKLPDAMIAAIAL